MFTCGLRGSLASLMYNIIIIFCINS